LSEIIIVRGLRLREMQRIVVSPSVLSRLQECSYSWTVLPQRVSVSIMLSATPHASLKLLWKLLRQPKSCGRDALRGAEEVKLTYQQRLLTAKGRFNESTIASIGFRKESKVK
jgi:hypothetical protein